MKPVLARLASGLGGAVDGAILSAMRMRFQDHRVRRMTSVDRRALLAEAIAFYRRPEVLGGERFFPAPPPLAVLAWKQRGEHAEMAFASPFEPIWERARAEYLEHTPNRTVHVRLFLHPAPRPAIVLLHGYGGGNFFWEERAFAARWLNRLGLDVILFTLPFHGRRGEGGAAPWPSTNVVRNNEGFAHAVFDLRALIGWLRQRGAPAVGVLGMSLGGYTAALAATVEALDFAFLMVPVASFADLLWHHGAGGAERARAEREGITLDMVRQAMEVHTPLGRRPLLPPERVLVVSAEADRIAPPEHASRLARHFGAEHLRFAGGHVLQVGRGDALRALARRLAALGQLTPRTHAS